jgi:F-type H+-transporting ATPase subunit delta
MGEQTLARRYARALLEVARERKEIAAVGAEIRAVAQVYGDLGARKAGEPDLRSLVTDPSRPVAARRELLVKVFGGRVSDLVLRFLILLLEKKRFGVVAEIADAYDHLADEAQGVARARVTTFRSLGDLQRVQLIDRLRRLTDRPTVVLEETVDPEILGGLFVRIGDQVIDGSIRGRLRRLRERLVIREEDLASAAAAMAGEGME